MAISYSPWYKRKILYRIPFLYKKCPDGNYHPFWDRLCFCRVNEHIVPDTWHGGVYDFVTGGEYIPYYSDKIIKLSRFRDEHEATVN